MTVGSSLTRGNTLLFIYILISSLWRQGKISTLSSGIKHAIPRKNRLTTLKYAGYMTKLIYLIYQLCNSVESGERKCFNGNGVPQH